MTPDKIYLAIGGDQQGRTLRPDDFKEKFSLYQDPNRLVQWLISPSGTDDTLKLGELHNANLNQTDGSDFIWRVGPAAEDCVDMRGCTNVVFSGECLAGGSRIFTIKDSQNIVVHSIIIGKPKKYDVVIGQYSDQGNSYTKGILLNLVRTDRSPITVDVWNGDVPSTAPGSGPYVFTKRNKLLVKAWLFVRSLWAKIS